MRSPIRWFGGKGNLVKKLIPYVPSHEIYVEVFGGGASLLFAKEPSSVEVYNDVDDGLVNFFSVVRDKSKFFELQRLLSLTPCSRVVYDDYRKSWNVPDEIERAYRWFVVARQSFSGNFGSGWCSTIKDNWRGIAASVATYLSAVDRLEEVHLRLVTTQVEKQDFGRILERYDTPETFFYCDPPYVHSTRNQKRYSHDLSDEDHKRLVESLLKVRGKVLLSGYRNEIYLPLEEAGWSCLSWSTSNFAVARTKATGVVGKSSAKKLYSKEETIWFNYEVTHGSSGG